MAWTAPATAVVGQILTAAFLNAQLRDNFLAVDALLDLATGSFTDGGLLLGSGSGSFTAMGVLADGTIVVGDGATDPVALAAFSSSTGQLLMARGGTGADLSGVAIGGLIKGSGSGTVAVLAKGSALQVLRVNAGATDLEYATPATDIGLSAISVARIVLFSS